MISDSDLKARFPQSFGYLASVRKTSLRLVGKPCDDASIPIGATKLGGAPDLSSPRDWPASGDGSMSFVAQVRLEPIGDWDEDALLPREGLLLFFAASDGTSGRVLHVTAPSDEALETKLRRTKTPDDAASHPAAAATLVRASSFPRAPSPFIDLEAIHPTERASYDKLLRELDVERGAPDHRLLGYPSDPAFLSRADGDTRMLLQLDDDARLEFAWESGKLVYLAQDAELRRGAISSARVAERRAIEGG